MKVRVLLENGVIQQFLKWKVSVMNKNEAGQQVNVPEENPLETSEAIPVYETKDFEENVSAFANDFGFEDIF